MRIPSEESETTPGETIGGTQRIPAGPFLMGSEDWGPFESPQHTVHLDDYYIDETLVTNAQFAAFVDATGYETDAEKRGAAHGYVDGKFKLIVGMSWRSHFTDERADHPVVMVSWNDAAAYAAWSGKRLPTEAEWEKAARGGLEDKLYPWGDEEPDGTQSNFAKSPASVAPTTAVKTFVPNGFGLYDMAGNTWMWCADWYDEDYYAKSPLNNPAGPTEGELRVRRGGSWNVIQPFRLRNANRGAARPETSVPNMGFRCALDVRHQMRFVDAILDKIRPAMEADGGGVELVGVRGGTVEIQLKGMCLDCPSVSMTLKLGIEKTLREHIRWFTGLVRVGENVEQTIDPAHKMTESLDVT